MKVSRILTIALSVALGVSAVAPVSAEVKQIEAAEKPVVIVYKVIGTAGEEVRSDVPEYRWKTVTVAPDEVDEVMEELKADPTIGDIEISQPVHTIKPIESRAMDTSAQYLIEENPLYNDPILPEQKPWQTKSKENPGLMSIADAHQVFDLSKKATIGVIDGGFAETEDMTYAGGAAFSLGTNTTEFRETALNPGCEFRHGTHVSHLAAAKFNNGTGMAGVANADIIAARTLECSGSGYSSDTAQAILWLSGEPVSGLPTLSEPVDVINMSLGSWTGADGCPAYTQDAIKVARSRGVLLVAAAGNDGSEAAFYSPANCEGVLTVGSNYYYGTPAYYSNHGDAVDLYATGNVVSMDDRSGKIMIAGTSFSAPIVAGHAALVQAMRPDADHFMLTRIMKESLVPLLEPGTEHAGGGILNSLMLAQNAADDSYVSPFFGHALMHEDRINAEAYTQSAAGLDTCNLYEVDTTKLDELTRPSGDFFKVFEVPKASDFLTTQGTEIARSQGTRVLVKNIDPEVNDYGIAVCNDDNSVCTSEIPVNLSASHVLTQAYCGS